MTIQDQSLEDRIKDQFPSLFITLVSVLIGLVLADLVAEARTRMVFWPINLHTLCTWFEFSTNGLSALVAWIVYSHIGVSRRHVPTLADALIAFSVPLALLFGTSFVGIDTIWPWFYFASFFLAMSLASTLYLLRVLRDEPELSTFGHIFRPSGYLSIFVSGIPSYALAGWLDQHHHLSPLVEMLLVATAPPSALVACHLFLRDWREAVSRAKAAGNSPAA